jgi:hypothetical protein
MSQELSPLLQEALVGHKDKTKKLAVAFSEVLHTQDIVDALNDSSNEGKPGKIYESLYREMARQGRSVREIHAFLQKSGVERGVAGILPTGVKDVGELHEMIVILNNDVGIQFIALTAASPPQVILKKGTQAMIDAFVVPYKQVEVSFSSIPFLALRIQHRDAWYHAWVKWTEVEPVL